LALERAWVPEQERGLAQGWAQVLAQGPAPATELAQAQVPRREVLQGRRQALTRPQERVWLPAARRAQEPVRPCASSRN